MQKFVVLPSAFGHAASSAFAILWSIARSQAFETQSELLHMFSSLVQLHWFKFLATSNGVLSIFERTFWILWFGRIIGIGCKSIDICKVVNRNHSLSLLTMCDTLSSISFVDNSIVSTLQLQGQKASLSVAGIHGSQVDHNMSRRK